jgi:hypothetical protein
MKIDISKDELNLLIELLKISDPLAVYTISLVKNLQQQIAQNEQQEQEKPSNMPQDK